MEYKIFYEITGERKGLAFSKLDHVNIALLVLESFGYFVKEKSDVGLVVYYILERKDASIPHITKCPKFENINDESALIKGKKV